MVFRFVEFVLLTFLIEIVLPWYSELLSLYYSLFNGDLVVMVFRVVEFVLLTFLIEILLPWYSELWSLYYSPF